MAEVAFRDYLNEIDSLIEHGSIVQALQHCRHLLAQHPKAVEVYRLLGKALLEQEEDRAAQDVFQRVLSVDPEDFVARVGLSIIHDRNNEAEPAVWHMERAFEIAPSNALIQGELRRLYAQRDGEAPERIPLTRGALARMYAAGDLNAEAIADLRQLLAEQSGRIDFQMQLAEVLWRDEQRVEAAERTQQIVNTLPFCLKANLILGAILRASGANGESDEPLQRAQAVDPENAYAHRLFSGLGPLYAQTIMVDRLEVQTMDQMLEAPPAEAEEVPDWLRGLSDAEEPLVEEPGSMQAARLSPGLHMPDVATEVPDWLQGLTGESTAAAEAEVPDWLAALTGAAIAGAATGALADREREPEEVIVRPADEVVPDWITQLGQTGTLTPTEELPPAEEEPDWMAQLREAPPAPFSAQIPDTVDTETPDWLAALTGAAVADAAVKAVTDREPEAEEIAPTDVAESAEKEGEEPAWLSQLREIPPAPFSEQIPDTVDTETPDWLAALTGAAVAGAAVEAIADREPEAEELGPQAAVEYVEREDEEPAWIAQLREAPPAPFSEQIPADQDTQAPDWLAQLRASTGEAEVAEETREDTGFDLGIGKAAVGLAGLMGAAVVAAHEAGEKVAEPTREPEQPIEVVTPREALVVESEPPIAFAGPVTTVEPEIPAEMPSADDALAFLSKLAAGKEDQLRAQAEQEAEARMAEIMGRKPAEAAPVAEEPAAPIKMTVPAATVAAVAAGLAAMKSTPEEKPAEPAAPQAVETEVPEEMPSADDALAFLAKLAAGKEDQLRVQAEQEAEARMAEIMGRKPSGPKPAEEEPGAGAAAVALGAMALAAGAVATTHEEPTAEIPEEMPSADDALAFLSKLAAGKEDQLRAQAEQEAEARMAAIMGRSAPLEPAQPIGPVTAPEAVIEPEETTDIAEPLAEADLPDWLKIMRPSDEAAVGTPETELPEWLRSMRPTEESADLGLASLIEQEEPPTEMTTVSEVPDWLHTRQSVEAVLEGLAVESEEPEAITTAEAAAVLGLFADLGEEQPREAEAEVVTPPEHQPPVPAQTSVLLPLEWWVQSAADTNEERLIDLPEPYLSPRARAAEKEKVAAAVASAETLPQERKLPQTGPLRQTGPLAVPQTGPLGTPEPAAASAEVETLLSRIYQDEQDYAARLDLARTYWATGNREGAYGEYLALVEAGEYARETMADLQTIVEIHDQTDWHRLLGDVYMKAGRLSSALEHYRRALSEV